MSLETHSALIAVIVVATTLATAPTVSAQGDSGPQQVRITVENLQPSDGFFFTPVWTGLHNGSFDLFNGGERASEGLEILAETGDTAPLSAEFEAPGRLQTTVHNGPIGPGAVVEGSIDIINPAAYRYFSFASMIIPSNDGFFGNGTPTAYELFDESGNFTGPVSFVIDGSRIYDSGTEVNTGSGAAGFSLGFDGQGSGESTDDPTGTVAIHPDLFSNLVGLQTAAGTTIGSDGSGAIESDETVARITVDVVSAADADTGDADDAAAAGIDGSSFFIRDGEFGRYLEAQPNVNVYTSNQTNTAAEWIVRDAGDGNYLIESVSTGLYLDADGADAGYNVDLTGPVDESAYWQIVDADGGYYLRNVGTERLLNASRPGFNADTSTEPGASTTWELIAVDGDAAAFEGAVFVGTNGLDANEIAAFGRNADGSLSHIGNFATGGTGSTDFDGGEGLDPLISADSLVVTEDESILLAVNAGSNSISSFAINDDFTLTLLSEVDSGGVGPNSIAVNDGLVFVTNIDRDGLALGEAGSTRGEPNDEGNIVGFYLNDAGALVATGQSADLDNRPADVDFSTDGDRLIVSSITSGSAALPGANAEASLYSFDILRSGRLQLADTGTPTLRGNAEGRNLPSAIDFDITVIGGREFVVVTEAREFNSEGAPPALPALQAGSVTVYELGSDSSLTITEGDLAIGDPTAPNLFGADGQQLTACWIDFGHDGETFYVSNAINATISSFRLQADGTVEVIDTVAAAGTTPFTNPGEVLDGPTTFGNTDGFIDLDVSPDGEYLYQLAGLSGTVGVYDVAGDGSLNLIQEISDGLPEIDTQGIISIGG